MQLYSSTMLTFMLWLSSKCNWLCHFGIHIWWMTPFFPRCTPESTKTCFAHSKMSHSMEVSIVHAALPIEYSWDCPYIQLILHGKLLPLQGNALCMQPNCQSGSQCG